MESFNENVSKNVNHHHQGRNGGGGNELDIETKAGFLTSSSAPTEMKKIRHIIYHSSSSSVTASPPPPPPPLDDLSITAFETDDGLANISKYEEIVRARVNGVFIRSNAARIKRAIEDRINRVRVLTDSINTTNVSIESSLVPASAALEQNRTEYKKKIIADKIEERREKTFEIKFLEKYIHSKLKNANDKHEKFSDVFNDIYSEVCSLTAPLSSNFVKVLRSFGLTEKREVDNRVSECEKRSRIATRKLIDIRRHQHNANALQSETSHSLHTMMVWLRVKENGIEFSERIEKMFTDAVTAEDRHSEDGGGDSTAIGSCADEAYLFEPAKRCSVFSAAEERILKIGAKIEKKNASAAAAAVAFPDGDAPSIRTTTSSEKHRGGSDDGTKSDYGSGGSGDCIGSDEFLTKTIFQIAKKSAAAITAELKVDATTTLVISATSANSFARLAGAESAAWIAAGVMPGTAFVPSVVTRAGDEMRFFHLETARRVGKTDSSFDESAIAMSAQYGLFSGISSSACVSTGINGNSADVMTAASSIASMFSRESFFDTSSPQMIATMCFPMISPDRLELDSSSWLEVGRAIATSYRCEESLGDVGLAVWIELSAQKKLIQKAKEWAAEQIIGTTFPTAPDTERKFIQWMFNANASRGSAISYLRGDDETMAPSASPSHVADFFDSMYCSNSPDIPRPEIVAKGILEDPFFSRTFGVIYNHLNNAVSDVSQLPDPNGDSIASAAKDYILFRSQFKSTMQDIHSEVVNSKNPLNSKTHAQTLAFEINDVSNSKVRSMKREGVFSEKTLALSVIPSTLLMKKKGSGAVGGAGGGAAPTLTTKEKIAESISATAFSIDGRKESNNIQVIAETRAKNSSTPEDYEWSSTQERNCSGMFIEQSKQRHFVCKTTENRRKIRDTVRLKFPAIDAYLRCDGSSSAAAAASADDTKTLFSGFMMALSQIQTQEEMNEIIGAAVNKIAVEVFTAPCEARWNKFENEKRIVTVRTIASFAMKDSPTEYAVWHERWAFFALYAAVNDKDSRELFLGQFAARMLWQSYLCAPKTTVGGANSATWYKFESNHLRTIQGSSEVYSDLFEYAGGAVTTCLNLHIEKIALIKRKISSIKETESSPDEVQYLESVLTHTESITKELGGIKKLLFGRGKKGVVDAMMTCSIIVSPNFSDVENQNPSTVAFLNGVIDICEDEYTDDGDGGGGASDLNRDDSDYEKLICFRPGKIEDYITMTTEISMPYGGNIIPSNRNQKRSRRHAAREYSDAHPDVVFLMSYLDKVFPDKDLCEYMLRDLASFFYGRNLEKFFRIWSGSGNNSKSILLKILQKAFGKYFFDLPAEAMAATQFVSASGPNPALAQGDGARGGVMTEPSGGMKLDSGIVKRTSGGDRTFSRKCNENGGSKVACWKPILQCNEPPSMSNIGDEQAKKRIIIIPFMSSWNDAAAALTIEEQWINLSFSVDINFERNVDRLAKALVWKLFHSFADYKKIGILEKPAIVIKVIEEYWRNIDMYLLFQGECVERAPEPASETTLIGQDLYTHFTAWHSVQYPGDKYPSFVNFRDSVIRKDRIGPFHIDRGGGAKSAWIGIRIKPSSVEELAVVVPPSTPSTSVAVVTSGAETV